MTDTKSPPEKRVVLPVDPTRRTEIDKQRVPMSARPYRLLALVKQDAVVRVQKEPDDTVMTWPHLLTIEFLAAGMMSIFLLLMGLFINAPLEELANSNVTPAVAKAPWYFLGLQELLAYFHPTVAGVLTPLLVLVGAGVHPVRRPRQPDRDAAVRAQDRGHPVHAVLRPRPDPDVRRDLLPRPGLQLRHPVPAVLRELLARPPLLPLITDRIRMILTSELRMSNYHVEPADRPKALVPQAIKSLRRAPGPGDLAAPAPALLDRRRDRACGCSRSPPARSASSGRTCPAASAAR